LNPPAQLRQYVHEYWQSDRGLPEDTVFAIAQTRDRYLWIGTYAGLARFDGIRFTVFDMTNTAAFRSQGISSLLERRRRTAVDCHQEWPRPVRTRLVSPPYLARWSFGRSHYVVYRDTRGAVWIGTETALTKYCNGVWVRYSTSDGLAHPGVNVIAEGSVGRLWFGTQGGVSYLWNNHFRSLHTSDGLADEVVQALYAGAGDEIWIGTRKGLNRFQMASS
jgi:ligand-binding sensor domain-containing protein